MVKKTETGATQYAKRAMSAYMFFANDNRAKIIKKNGLEGKAVGDVAKKIAEEWNSITPKDKKVYETKAAKDKERFQKDLAKGLQVKPRKGKKEGKAKKVKDPNAPKRAMTAYMYYINANRAAIAEEHGVQGVAEVAKKAGELWKALGEADKKKYEKLAEEDKERYAKEMENYKPPVEEEEEEEEEE